MWLSVSAEEPPHPPVILVLLPSVNRPERELKEISSLCVMPLCNSREINIKQKAEMAGGFFVVVFFPLLPVVKDPTL